MEATQASELVIVNRTIDAPRQLIWKAMTELEHIEQWVKPKGFKMTIIKYDFRKGGMRHWGLHSPNGSAMWERATFPEIVPQEKLTYIFSYSDENGGISRSPYMTNFPLEVQNEVTLTDENGKTKLIIVGKPVNCTEAEQKAYQGMHAGMQQGAKLTFDQLEEYVMKLQ